MKSVDQIADWADQTADRADLLARVIQAAANGRTAEKIAALGSLLGRTVQDDTRLDEAFVIAAALDEMEAPHVRLLALVNGAGGSDIQPAAHPGKLGIALELQLQSHVVPVLCAHYA